MGRFHVAYIVSTTVRAAAGDLLEDAQVFDVFVGEQVGAGKKSLAVNVKLRAADRTFDAEEILGVRKAIIAGAEKAHGAVLRWRPSPPARDALADSGFAICSC